MSEPDRNRSKAVAKHARETDQPDRTAVKDDACLCKFRLRPGSQARSGPPLAMVFFIKGDCSSLVHGEQICSMSRLLEPIDINIDHCDRMTESADKRRLAAMNR